MKLLQRLANCQHLNRLEVMKAVSAILSTELISLIIAHLVEHEFDYNEAKFPRSTRNWLQFVGSGAH